jgi:aminoglycoside phosphotransferase (APT) family kinase protein
VIGPRLASGATAPVHAWGDRAVVKVYHEAPGPAEREAEHTRAARAAGAAAPAVIDVVTIEDRVGVVFERVDRPTMLDALPTEGPPALLARFAALHADLHALRAPTLPAQREIFRAKIEHGHRRGPEPVAAVLAVVETLPDGEALCHGDFHPQNVVLTAGGPRIIDWLNATRGDPLGDVARTLALIEHARSPAVAHVSPGMRSAVARDDLHRYSLLRPVDPSALHRWTVVALAGRLSEQIGSEERATLVAAIDAWLGAH